MLLPAAPSYGDPPVKRMSILIVTLLALVVVACSGDPASPTPSESTPPATPDPTATPTAEPTVAASEPAASADPAASSDASGDGTALADLLPDELNGMSRTDVPGIDAMLAPLLAQSGVDASEADFTFASYGEGDDAVYVQGFRIPGMTEVELEMLARAMSGGQTGSDVSAETATVGGKEVLRIGGTDVPDAGYLYFSDGAMFTVISQSDDLAEQLLEQLP